MKYARIFLVSTVIIISKYLTYLSTENFSNSWENNQRLSMSYLQRKISLIVFDDKSIFLYSLYYICKKKKEKKNKKNYVFQYRNSLFDVSKLQERRQMQGKT